MQPQEAKVISLKYAAKRFGSMSFEEKDLSANSILVKISIITGWAVPPVGMMELLIGQLVMKMGEDYANVNEEEMEYAFRNKEVETKNWGMALSLSLIDDVMIPYLKQRFELSQMEEQIRKPIMIEDKKDMPPEEMIEWIDEWKTKEDVSIDLIPLSFYKFLTDKKKIEISADKKFDYLNQAASQIKVQMQIKITELNSYNGSTVQAYIDLAEFNKMEKEGFTGLLKDRITNRAKKLIVYDYLKK